MPNLPRRAAGNARRRLSPAAVDDLREVLVWTTQKFSTQAAARYAQLIKQAIADLVANPQRPGSRERPDLLVPGARTYHLFFSRDRVRTKHAVVRNPRHFIVYRQSVDGVVEIARILHDQSDLPRHLPQDYRVG